MPDEDKIFVGSLVLDFRKWWRHVKTIYYVSPYSDKSHFCSHTWHLSVCFPTVWSRYTMSLSAPKTLVNVLLSSVVTLSPHFLFIDNSHKSFDFWFGFTETFTKRSFDSFAILSSWNDPFKNIRTLASFTANGVSVCMFERRKDGAIC